MNLFSGTVVLDLTIRCDKDHLLIDKKSAILYPLLDRLRIKLFVY